MIPYRTWFMAMVLSCCCACGFIVDVILPSNVSVSLINASPDFSVEATLVYSNQDDLPGEVLIEFGVEREFTLAPGEILRFSVDCDDLRALVLADADLLVLTGIGPETDSGVLRIHDDFECGDEIAITFTHSDLILDFEAVILIH